jgi:hypothetical protein
MPEYEVLNCIGCQLEVTYDPSLDPQVKPGTKVNMICEGCGGAVCEDCTGEATFPGSTHLYTIVCPECVKHSDEGGSTPW